MLKKILIASIATATVAAYLKGNQAPSHTERPLGISIEIETEHYLDAKVDSTPKQDLSVTHSRASVSYQRPVHDGFLKTKADYTYSQYDFSGNANDLDVNSLGLNAIYSRTLHAPWGFFMMTGLQWRAENAASMGEGFTYNIAGGVSYDYSEDFKLMAGIGYGSRLVDSDSFYPAIGIDWQITERLNLRSANGAYLTYDWHGDKQTVLDTSIEYQSQQFAIADTVASGDRATEETLWKLTAGVTQQFENGWYIRPALHVAFERELETRTERTGTTQLNQDTNPGLSLHAGFSF